MSKIKEPACTSSVLLIGGSAGDIGDRPVCRIGDDWTGLLKGPSGRNFHDFKRYVIWPTPILFNIPATLRDYTAACRDLNITLPEIPKGYFQTLSQPQTKQKVASSALNALPSPIERFKDARILDCYNILQPLISNIVAGSVIILVVPDWMAGIPTGQQTVLRWLSRSLLYARSDDRKVTRAATLTSVLADMPADFRYSADKITSIYRKITSNVQVWPPLAFYIPGGYPLRPLNGLHVLGEHFSQNAADYGPDVIYGDATLDRHKDVPVVTAPGHINMRGDYKSLLFISGRGGVIVIPQIVKLADLLDILIAEDAHEEPEDLQPTAGIVTRPSKKKNPHRTGRKPATREKRTADEDISKRWESAKKITAGRVFISEFAREQGMDEKSVRRALDNNRKRKAALKAAHSRL